MEGEKGELGCVNEHNEPAFPFIPLHIENGTTAFGD
jgi:hypothetical protein